MIRKVLAQYDKAALRDDKICCPLHGENTPSFTIYDHDSSWHCYGACGEGGDAIDFVMKADDIGFKEARDKVTKILGMSYEQFKEEKGKLTEGTVVTDSHPPMTRDELKEMIQSAGYVSHGYRGIKDEYNKFFGHLTRLDENKNVISRHYPESNLDSKISGYKCRNHPKDFTHGNVGKTGSKNQLSGQVKFGTVGGKYLLIVGGEEDKVAAYQMLAENRSDKDFDPIHVVSPTCGENTAAKQVAAQFSFCDRYENIIIGMDNDEAGRKAAEAISAVLPKDKVKIANWSGKDPNKMLLDRKEKQFCRDFWNAKPLVASAIKESAGLMDSVREELMRPRISLPQHWHELQSAMKGGILQGRIVNIIGDTSVGKSTHINDLVYYWMFNAPEKVGVVSLEATEGQYTLDLLSIHLEKNLLWLGDGDTILEYLDKPEVKALYDNLLTREDGRSRFAILDERDGDIAMLERQIEKLIHQHDCKIIVIDVLTDILRGMDKDAQEEHMKFQKRIVKSGITIFNVLHTRKPANSDGTWKMPTEYDAFGSSTFVQSAAINIVIGRNKMAECSIERNRTYVHMPKCRGGDTGEICSWIYDQKTRRVMDYNDWVMREAGIKQTHQQEVQQETPVQDDMRDYPPPDETYNPQNPDGYDENSVPF